MLTKTNIVTFTIVAVLTTAALQPAHARDSSAIGPMYAVNPESKTIAAQVGGGKSRNIPAPNQAAYKGDIRPVQKTKTTQVNVDEGFEVLQARKDVARVPGCPGTVGTPGGPTPVGPTAEVKLVEPL